MSRPRIPVQSAAALSVIAALFLAACGGGSKDKLQPADQTREWRALLSALGSWSIRGSQGSSPVRIVGGSMTFRAVGGWTTSDSGKTWTTTDSVNAAEIMLERVVPKNSGAAPTDYTYLLCNTTPPCTGWSIEVDGRTPKGDAISAGGNGGNPNGVSLVLNAQSHVVISATSNSASGVGFYGADAPTSDVSPQGVRYMDKSKTGSGSSADCTAAGSLCESIWQIQVTVNGSNQHNVFYCPDGECRVYLLTLPTPLS